MEQMQSLLEGMDDRTFVFGSLFVTANLMETLLDRAFAPYGITVKQWLLLITITSLFAEPPTMKQVAGAMGTSTRTSSRLRSTFKKAAICGWKKIRTMRA